MYLGNTQEYFDASAYRNALNILDSVIATLKLYSNRLRLDLTVNVVNLFMLTNSGIVVSSIKHEAELDGYAIKTLSLGKNDGDKGWDILILKNIVGIGGNNLGKYAVQQLKSQYRSYINTRGNAGISDPIYQKLGSTAQNALKNFKAKKTVSDNDFVKLMLEINKYSPASYQDILYGNELISRQQKSLVYYDLMSELRTLERELNRLRIPMFQGALEKIDAIERLSNYPVEEIADYQTYLLVTQLLSEMDKVKSTLIGLEKKAIQQPVIPPTPATNIDPVSSTTTPPITETPTKSDITKLLIPAAIAASLLI